MLTRSSRQEVFCQKSVLKNFTKLTEKDLCLSHFLKKFKASNFIKKWLQHRRFPVNFATNNYFAEHFWTVASG